MRFTSIRHGVQHSRSHRHNATRTHLLSTTSTPTAQKSFSTPLLLLQLLLLLLLTACVTLSLALEKVTSTTPPAQCSVTTTKGCYVDSANARVLPYQAHFCGHPNEDAMTREKCAELCCAAGYNNATDLVGVEYGCQCYCGHAPLPANATKAPTGSTACSMPCSGNHSQTCGGSDAIDIFTSKCSNPSQCVGPPAPPPPPPPPPPGPEFHGCNTPNATVLPYCDMSLSYQARVADLIQRMSTDEKIAMLSPTAPPYCACHTASVPRLGMPRYKWLTEINTCVSAPRGCLGPNQCITTFVGPLGMAASFNRSSWWLKGDVVSTDLRVLNNQQGSLVGLTAFGPNINMVKDPLYGRNSELAGEDPFLSGQYAVSYLQGMQQTAQSSTNGREYLKMLAYVKHYTAYNVEASRFTFTANVSMFDLWDTYLAQYEPAFKQGMASGAMCSYFGVNGTSSCGNDYLLNGIIRGKWARPDTVVMSDCSAIANMMKNG
eukprot:UC1_evm1s1722